VKFYGRDIHPYGRSWEEWVELWWKWCYSKPYDANSVSDNTGELCSKNQRYTDVWFLAGTFGGNAQRECKIPYGRSIFFPIVNDIISFAEYPKLKTENALHNYAKKDLDTTRSLYLNIDGAELHGLFDYRIHSRLFAIKIPMISNGERIIRTQAISDGYWVFIEPLPLGEHTLTFTGEKEAFDEIELDQRKFRKSMFRVDVIYHLIVV
jgi:hypothetical protein